MTKTEYNPTLGEEITVDITALISAVSSRTDRSVFQDAYGPGVAIISGRRFDTYRELAAAYDLNVLDFQA